MSAIQNVAIVGASGSIGKIILDGLLASSKFNITVISRKESTATFPDRVVIHRTDFSDSDLEQALRGQDAVISAVGANGFGDQTKVADAAIRAGVKRFIPSEFSASSQDDAVVQLLPLFGVKSEMIDYLKSAESASFSWTGIAAGLLFDWGIANGFLEYDIEKRSATIWDDGNKKFTLTNEKQLGAAVVSVLEHPEETKNKYLFISSVETSQNEILSALEEATASKWNVSATTTETQVSEARDKLGAGDFSGAFALVRATSFSNTSGLRANYAKDETLANTLLGLREESVKESVARVVNAS